MHISTKRALPVLIALAAFATPALADPIAEGGPELIVSFDIRPAQCPNRVITELGFGPAILPTAIVGTDDVDVNDISANSLLLIVPEGGGFGGIGIPPIDTETEDVATPVDDPSDCNCTADGSDVVLDLSALFDQDAILDQLELVNPDAVQPEFELCITGLLNNGTPFRGCDCILVNFTPPVATSSSTWGRVKSTYR